MRKPTYEDLEKRVKHLETIAGQLIDSAMEDDEHEIFELSVLYNISQAVASTMDLDELLTIVIDEVNKALLTEGAGVLLYDENRGDLYWRQVRDARQILAPQSDDLRLPLDKSIAGWVFRNNKPARVNDVSKDPRYYPEMTRKSGFEIRKTLQVPLIAKDGAIGVIMVMNKIGGDFTDQDEALLTSMAATIALAIDNATVYHRLKKSRDDLEMIYRSSLALATTLDLDHLLGVVITELRTALDTEAGGVLLYDEAKGDLYWREVQDAQGLIHPKSADVRLPLTGSISGKVFQTGEPALINNPQLEPMFFRPFAERTGFTIRNEIIVPLNTREKTIGVLVVMNKREGRFTQDDTQILLSLAGVVALAVENAGFFEELMTSYRELEDLNRVKTKVLNHLSHELRTPLSIIRGTLATMRRKLNEMGVKDFDRPLSRMNRHVEGLHALEAQVESIMMTGYAWERRFITGFLQAALDLMELQTERTPEIRSAAETIHQWLEKTFPTHKEVSEVIPIREFGETIQEYVATRAQEQDRKVNIFFDLESADLFIPRHALQSVMEGLIKNAVEATPDNGCVWISGKVTGNRYVMKVKDTGIGIPERDKDFIFEGFYPVQETEAYSSKRPYSFNAGGKGIDLLRIRMFSELYEFRLSFTSRRCPHLVHFNDDFCADLDLCEYAESPQGCIAKGGSEFIVDFPMASCFSEALACDAEFPESRGEWTPPKASVTLKK